MLHESSREYSPNLLNSFVSPDCECYGLAANVDANQSTTSLTLNITKISANSCAMSLLSAFGNLALNSEFEGHAMHIYTLQNGHFVGIILCM